MVKTKCLVFSRTVGYLSPTNQWNEGKAQEFKDRIMINLTKNDVNR
jgi:anaerobic ribonucleoside-triphosphate reductase